MHKTQRLLTIIRPIQFLILLIIIALEIVQLVGFSADRDNFEFPNELNSAALSNEAVPWSGYFEDMNVIHGVKIFYFIVIILTLVCPQFFWKRFNRAEILSRDKYYEFLYFALWVSVCFTNLDPTYVGQDLDCDGPQWSERGQGFRCKAYLSSLFFSFLMAATWVISTMMLIGYINLHKDELADKLAEKKRRKTEMKNRNIIKSSAENDESV